MSKIEPEHNNGKLMQLVNEPGPLLDVVHLSVEFGTCLPRPVFKEEIPPAQGSPGPQRVGSPYDWTFIRKQVVLWICCFATVFASFAASSYAPCKEQLVEEWDVSAVAVLVGITTFTTGFGLGPMFLAPLSELRGRKPVFGGTGLLFIICQICCAVTRSYPGMLVARFWTGVGSSTYSTLVGGVISDMYRSNERNTPMALFSGCALFGVGLGPLVCGFIGQYSSWRWVFWIQVIVNAILVGLFMLFVPETYESTLLSKERDGLNKWAESLEQRGVLYFNLHGAEDTEDRRAQRVRWETSGKQGSETDIKKLIATSLTRPFIMLCKEPIVTYLSLWAAFSWSVLYIALAVVPLMFMDVYGFSLSQADSVFASACLGSLVATVVGIVQEKCLSRVANRTSN